MNTYNRKRVRKNIQNVKKSAKWVLTNGLCSDILSQELESANHQPLKNGDGGMNMNLRNAELGKEYIIRGIVTDDEELNQFLFSLGCYSGEPITVVSRKRGSCTVSIKDGRYSIDDQLAEAIEV